MNYLDVQTLGASKSPSTAVPAGARDVVVLQLPAAGRMGVSKRQKLEILPAARRDARIMPPAGTRGTPPAGRPARRSAFRQLVECFGVTGESLAFGSAFDLGPPSPASSPLDTPADARNEVSRAAKQSDAGPTRARGWISKVFAAARRSYQWQAREAAIRSAVRELSRADDALLRDLGIPHRTSIEFFVRNGMGG